MLSVPFLDPSGNKNISAAIQIGRKIRCLLYVGFISVVSFISEHSFQLVIKKNEQSKKIKIISNYFGTFFLNFSTVLKKTFESIGLKCIARPNCLI